MKYIFYLSIIIIGGLLITPAFLPKGIHASVKKSMPYSNQTIFHQFNHLKPFSQWNPWLKKDPKATIEFIYPYYGQNAIITWESTSKEMGSGEIQIIKSIANTEIVYQLTFNHLGSKNISKVIITPKGPDQSMIEWSLTSSDAGYFNRYVDYVAKPFLEKDLMNGLDSLEIFIKNNP